MRADVYQKLHEFNLHIDQGMATLRGMAQIKKVSARESEHMAEYLEELRSFCSGWLTSIVSGQEERGAGRLFGRRRRQEMAEAPLHGGWLEKSGKRSGSRSCAKPSGPGRRSHARRRARASEPCQRCMIACP